MKEPLIQDSNGPILFPEMQDPFDPHHPIFLKVNNVFIFHLKFSKIIFSFEFL